MSVTRGGQRVRKNYLEIGLFRPHKRFGAICNQQVVGSIFPTLSRPAAGRESARNEGVAIQRPSSASRHRPAGDLSAGSAPSW